MPHAFRQHAVSLLVLAAAAIACVIGASVGFGCGETLSPHTTRVVATAVEVLAPKAPEQPKAAPAEPTGAVTLVRLKYDAFRTKVATNSKAKFILVDAWATNCGPCKTNFPHLVQMHHKYVKDGLAVVSLSFDDPSNDKDVAAAERFLRDQKAVFTNVLLDEDAGVGYEKLEVNAIPAVFLFAPDGKEIRRFTMDDPDDQFTYAEVEETVAALLQGKPAPEKVKTKAK